MSTKIITESVPYVNMKTGEEEVFTHVKRYTNENFYKMYLTSFMSVLGIFNMKQVDVFVYVCSHANPTTNIFIGNMRQIAKECNCSVPTVQATFNKLYEGKFIKNMSTNGGIYMVNPDCIYKGSLQRKAHLLITYENIKAPELTEEEREQRSLTEIQALEEELKIKKRLHEENYGSKNTGESVQAS